MKFKYFQVLCICASCLYHFVISFQVLQQPKDLDLDLYNKENKIVAVITLQNITSKPVSYEVDNKGASLSGAG